MKQHSFDPLSFIFGLIFVASAGAAVWRDQLRWDLDEWFLPIVIFIAGVALLASAIKAATNKTTTDPGT